MAPKHMCPLLLRADVAWHMLILQSAEYVAAKSRFALRIM